MMTRTTWSHLSAAAIAAVLLSGVSAVRAQTPATLARVTVQGEAAKRIMTKTQINAETARALVDACVEFGKSSNATYSVFVLAPNGDIIASQVMDGQLPIAVETAQLKAKTALYARSSSSAVAQRFSTTEGRLIRLDLGKASGLAYYFVGGGLPIVVEDQLIGAIGVGGGTQDEMCAYTALTKVLGPQPPLTPAAPAAGGAAPAPGRGRGQ
jgi:uncharacterized protein GlcG (DUF336 family)